MLIIQSIAEGGVQCGPLDVVAPHGGENDEADTYGGSQSHSAGVLPCPRPRDLDPTGQRSVVSSRQGTYGRPRRGGRGAGCSWMPRLSRTSTEWSASFTALTNIRPTRCSGPRGPYLYGTVLRDGDLLRMWYHCIGDRGYRNCYATSIDGLSWQRPDVGLVEYAGSRSNSIVTDRNQCHNASVMPWPFVDDGLGRWVPSMASRGKRASSAGLGPWTASVGSGRRRQTAGCFGLPMW